MPTDKIFRGFFKFFLSIVLLTPNACESYARTNYKKGRNPIKSKAEAKNPSVIELLTSVQNKLSNEAARPQIQARGLSKAEIERLNTLYQSIGNLKEMITQLEKTTLKDDLAQPKAFAREPKTKPKPKPKLKAKSKSKEAK
ncbi:MAG: hypothetical protein AB8G05_18695 [Oligoflexales bacterium]